MKKLVPPFVLVILVALPSGLLAQARPKLIDAHIHHNGDPVFLEKLTAKLDSVDGLALLITAPSDLKSVTSFIKQHPNRLICMGELKLDDPVAVSLVDRFHDAGCRALGEISGPLYNYDDRRYWPIYERA